MTIKNGSCEYIEHNGDNMISIVGLGYATTRGGVGVYYNPADDTLWHIGCDDCNELVEEKLSYEELNKQYSLNECMNSVFQLRLIREYFKNLKKEL